MECKHEWQDEIQAPEAVSLPRVPLIGWRRYCRKCGLDWEASLFSEGCVMFKEFVEGLVERWIDTCVEDAPTEREPQRKQVWASVSRPGHGAFESILVSYILQTSCPNWERDARRQAVDALVAYVMKGLKEEL